MFTQPSKHRVADSGGQRLKSTITRLKEQLLRLRSRSRSGRTTKAPTSSASVPSTQEIVGDDATPGHRLPADLRAEAAKTPWYHDSINGREAKRILEPFPDGSFLLRNSEHDHHLFTVTYKAAGEYGSIRIDQDSDGLFTLNVTDPLQVRRSSPIALLEYVVRVQQATPLNIQDQVVVVFLQHPVARVKRILTLEELCKQSIRSSLPAGNAVDSLPLPSDLKVAVQAWNDHEQYHFRLLETSKLSSDSG